MIVFYSIVCILDGPNTQNIDIANWMLMETWYGSAVSRKPQQKAL